MSQYFVDTEDQVLKPVRLRKAIPLQIKDNAATKNLKSAGEGASAGTQTLVVGNLILNVALSGSLCMLWGMINALQIIVHMPMMQTNFPANTQMLLDMFISVANFKYFDTKPIYSKAFAFLGISEDPNDEQGVNPKFANQGMGSKNMAKNLGMMGVAIVFGTLFVLILIALYLKFREHPKLKFVLKKIWDKVFFSSFIRYMLEAYLTLVLTVYIASYEQ